MGKSVFSRWQSPWNLQRKKKFGKPSAELTDEEVLEIIGEQAASWDLQPGEYTLSHAVYVSAQKAVK